jgi:FkbM family methyltransferase
MRLKHRLRTAVENLANIHIYRVLPRGIDVAKDIANAFPSLRIEVVLDVGANVGQSAKRYVRCFSRARVYCLEPVQDTFRQLQENVRGNDRIHCVQAALGSVAGKGEMVLKDRPEMFFLLDRSKDPLTNEDVVIEEVDVVTLDDFCADGNIRQVNYLKIDTEGRDLDVLRGGENMLNEHRVDFVELEAGMNASNKRHVPFETLKDYLESKGYLLFGIYQQMHEWPTNEPHLRRTNPLFVSRSLIDANAPNVKKAR